MWTVTTRRPGMTNDLASIQNRMDRLMTDLMGPWAEGSSLAASWLPPVDVFEGKDALKIVAELPGVKPEDVKISLENRTLTLRGEKKQVAEETTEKVHRYERAYGSFERTFTLPGTVNPEQIQATYAEGLLTIVLPKVEQAKPREIPVKVG
jgi:HSP20 family protein